MKRQHIFSAETVTHAQRESAYVAGELAFKQGQRRACNPYSVSSPTLEQVWRNGWDHSRRIDKLALTVSRWHGWGDTAEEKSQHETTRLIQNDTPTRIHVP